jgi:TonB family protein
MRWPLTSVGLAFALFAAAPPALAQVPEPAPAPGAVPDSVVFEIADHMPELLGGLEGLAARLQYPEEALTAGIEGRVFVRFVVDEEGVPTEITVVRGIGGGCDEVAVEGVRASRFTPGMQGGRPVAVRMSLPVTFRLTEPPPAPRPPVVLTPLSPPKPETYAVVEEMPELIGGIARLQARIRYPEAARRAGIEGRVFVRFVVDEEGVPTEITVVRGIGGGCDEAAVAAVRASRFRPGLEDGRPVKVGMSLPVTFRLR